MDRPIRLVLLVVYVDVGGIIKIEGVPPQGQD